MIRSSLTSFRAPASSENLQSADEAIPAAKQRRRRSKNVGSEPLSIVDEPACEPLVLSSTETCQETQVKPLVVREECSVSTLAEPSAAEEDVFELAPNQLVLTLTYSLLAQVKQTARMEGVSPEDILVELVAEGVTRRAFQDASRPMPSHLMTRTGYLPPEAGMAAQPTLSHHGNVPPQRNLNVNGNVNGNINGNVNGNQRRFQNFNGNHQRFTPNGNQVGNGNQRGLNMDGNQPGNGNGNQFPRRARENRR